MRHARRALEDSSTTRRFPTARFVKVISMSAPPVVHSDASPIDPTLPPSFATGPWIVSIVLSFALGMVAYKFSPDVWDLPERLQNVPTMSPQSVLDEIRDVERVNLWYETTLRFALVGTAIGLCGLILHLRELGRSMLQVLVPLLSGGICGALAGMAALGAREYFDTGKAIPLVSEEMRAIFGDIVVFATASLLLTLPIAVLLGLQRTQAARKKAPVVPLAGFLTGVIIPIAAVGVLSSHTKTDVFPPLSFDLVILWFVTLTALTVLFVVFSGDRKPRVKA